MSFLHPRYEAGRPAPEGLWVTTWDHFDPSPLDIHVHPGVEVGVVMSGEEEIQFSGLVRRCHAGDAWLCNAWEPHGWRISEPHTHIAVAIFRPEFMGGETVGGASWWAPFSVPPQLRPVTTSPELRRRVGELGARLSKEIAERGPHWEEMVRRELLCLLLELVRNWEYRNAPGLLPLQGVDANSLSRLMPALTAVHTSSSHTVPVAEAAAVCGLSASRFRWLFRQVMGVSFARFCLRSRLSHAADRLVRTSQPVSAIAAETGFVDASHLHHRFAEEYGCTPREFRRRSRRA